MYICLCNALKERDVHSVIADGASSVADTFSKLGCQPVCGQCVPVIRESLPSAQTVSE